MRIHRRFRIVMLLLGAASLTVSHGDPGAKRRDPSKPDPGKLAKALAAAQKAALHNRVDATNFAGKSSYAEFRATMVGERGFYSESRAEEDSLDLGDRMEALAYTRPEILASLGAELNPEPSMLTYSRACESGKKIVLGAVGDVLLHQPLAVQGMSRKNGFRSLWSALEPYMAIPDVMYANLEGPTAGAVSSSGRKVADPGSRFDKVAYTSYPMFNYHPDLVGDLLAGSVDVVSTANNHALDRRSLGADRTIENLVEHALPFTGTRTTEESARVAPEESEWHTITEAGGFRIAWIACTFSTNGIPDPKRQVLMCFSQRSIVLDRIRELRADPTIDAVVATPHWGIEYDHKPAADQRALARDMIEAGATIVFGNHPHVLQPVDKIVASDGHEGYVIYSLGNFVSGQKGVAKRTSALVYVGLTKNADGEVFINGTRHLPIAMTYGSDGLMVKPAKGNFEEARLLANRILSRSKEFVPGEDELVTNPGCP